METYGLLLSNLGESNLIIGAIIRNGSLVCRWKNSHFCYQFFHQSLLSPLSPLPLLTSVFLFLPTSSPCIPSFPLFPIFFCFFLASLHSPSLPSLYSLPISAFSPSSPAFNSLFSVLLSPSPFDPPPFTQALGTLNWLQI